MKKIIPINIDLDVLKNDSTDVTNLGSPHVYRGTTVVDGNKTSYKLSSISRMISTAVPRVWVRPGVWNNIARGKIVLDNEKFVFSKLPYIETDERLASNFKITITKKTHPLKYINQNDQVENTKYVTGCTYNILYRSKVGSDKTNPIYACVKYNTTGISDQISKKPAIRTIDFGNEKVSKNGETRNITIYGSEGAQFGIAINETFPNTTVNLSPAGIDAKTVDIFNKNEDLSLISKSSRRDVTRYFCKNGVYRDDLPILVGKIGKSGKTVIKQRFPSSVVREAEITNSPSSARFIELSGVERLKVGDRIHTGQIPDKTRITIEEINPDEGSDGTADDNKIKASAGVTITSGKILRFTRDRYYRIDVLKEYTPTMDDTSYLLTQKRDDKIITWSMVPNNDFKIDKNLGVSTGLSKNQALDIITAEKTITYRMLLDLESASHKWRSARPPKVNHRYAPLNDFGTASNRYDEALLDKTDGTKFKVTNFTYSPLNENTIEIAFKLTITEMGDSDITIPLTLSRFLKYS